MNKTAIIIGAGPAGLTAAYQLIKESNIKPIIIEKEAFVGGISRTVNYNGNRIDIGGHRFFSKNKEVNDMWQKLMPIQGQASIDDAILERKKPLFTGGPNPEKDDRVFLIRTRVSRILYLRKFFDYPISLKLQTFTNLGLRRTIMASFAYIKSRVCKHNEDSLENYMINRFGTVLYRMFFKDYTYKVWGKYPNEISSDWGAQRIKGLSLSKAILHMLKRPFTRKKINLRKGETSLIELFTYPKLGPGQYWESMAQEITSSGGDIILNSTVTGINISDHKIESVLVRIKDKIEEIKGDYFISSMPISELIPAMNIQVPTIVRETAINLPYRDFITVGLLVDKLKLKNTSRVKTMNNIVPDCWIYVQEPDVKMGRVQIFNNWSPYMVKDVKNTVWIGIEYFCQEGDEMWNQTDEDFISYAISESVKIGLIEKDSVLDSIRIKVEKAYPAYFGTYSDIDVVKDYINSFTNLFCIGRNGQHRYNNMDHSMLTAMETVKTILSETIDKSNIWNVNTESSYHEEKM